MKKGTMFLLGFIVILFLASPASALLIAGPDIIAAPASVIDDFPGAENDHQQAFNEAQDVLLAADLAVDAGSITAGTLVDSHMIFLNTPGSSVTSDIQVWMFDGEILGVMSDSSGLLEAVSSADLGAPGTIYPGAFAARGMEGGDSYSVSGNTITVNMVVSEPGDWIRVITGASIPEPAAMFLLGAGLIGIAGFRRRIEKK